MLMGFVSLLSMMFSLLLLSPRVHSASAEGIFGSSSTTVRVALPYSEDMNDSLPFYREYTEAISEYANWKLEYITCAWTEMFPKIQNGNVDLLVDITPTAERSQYLSYSSQPMGTELCYLYAKEDTPLHYDDFTAFNGMKVGYLDGSTIVESFQSYATASGFTFTAVPYQTNAASFAGLDKGEVDTVAQTNFFPVPSGHVVISKCSPAPVYFAMRKDDTKLNQLNEAMALLLSYNPNFNNDLFNYYFTSVLSQTSAFSKEEVAYLNSNPEVYMVYESNWAPFEYDQNGTPEGITPDVVRAIGELTKIKFKFLLLGSTQDIYTQLGTTSVDAVMAVSYSYRWATDHNLYTTQSYVSGGVVEVKKNSSVVAKKVGTVEGGYLENEITKKFPALERVPYATFNETMSALDKGLVDCVYLNTYQADYYRTMSAYTNFYYQPTPLITQPIALGITQTSNPVLVGILQNPRKSSR